MRPSYHEIQIAAYDRWERRGHYHGGDANDWFEAETELIFLGHYRPIAEHRLDADRAVLGDGPNRRCRFCERTPRQVDFGDPHPIVPGRQWPATAEVCGECRGDWLDPLDQEFRRFWDRLAHDPNAPLSIAAFKAMVAGALAVMPVGELPYFVDAAEWVSNPDHDLDDQLIVGAECLVYRAGFLHQDPGVTLYRRADDDDPVPYLIYFLRADGMMVQVPLPMCLRDEDLDGRSVVHLARSPIWGRGHDFAVARAVRLPLAVSVRRAPVRRIPSAIAS